MPAANQGEVGGATVRMRSTGLAQSAGGAGTSTSSIRKLPSGWSGTPTTAFVLRSIKGATASQISVAKTLALAVNPMRTPPPSSRPLPSTWIRPSAFTSAVRAEITQIWPAGWTPRTMLRFTSVVVGANPTPLATGMTPIPPRNFTSVSSATAGGANSATRTGKRTKAFFMVLLLLFLGWISSANGTRDRQAPPDLVIRHPVSRPRNGRPPRWESNAVTPSGPLSGYGFQNILLATSQ